ncbi:hypothetical protein BTJ39_00640 [Izhakiella australiensis]|uniref:HTH araC/xylS-type domain-containing protein n=1 Tax=Izhakiella australiensis TaxID=1926881 RepID=A0A1S8YRE0_9GAMM|nr:AraC family transcriptional regulator [Izhakiella australiensis]OON41709.1 hypothetical protein BTJ39_00640 [Izhakiella australiensis]
MLRQPLITLCQRYAPDEGENATAINGLTLFRANSVAAPLPSVYQPCLCFIVQGSKQVMLGNAIYGYQAGQHLAVSVDLPMLNQITHATPDAPYLLISMAIQPTLFSSLLAQAPHLLNGSGKSQRGVFVGDQTVAMGEGLLRLLSLLETPQDIAVLAEQTLREVLYRVLCAPGGERVAELAQSGSPLNRIARVIHKIRASYCENLPVEELAQLAGMSVSTFHAHFKTVTALSPLQYQKTLRLIEARHLMLSGQHDVAASAWQVGYESPSQFSREYSRMFGNPPARDISQLKRQAGTTRG